MVKHWLVYLIFSPVGTGLCISWRIPGTSWSMNPACIFDLAVILHRGGGRANHQQPWKLDQIAQRCRQWAILLCLHPRDEQMPLLTSSSFTGSRLDGIAITSQLSDSHQGRRVLCFRSWRHEPTTDYRSDRRKAACVNQNQRLMLDQTCRPPFFL